VPEVEISVIQQKDVSRINGLIRCTQETVEIHQDIRILVLTMHGGDLLRTAVAAVIGLAVFATAAQNSEIPYMHDSVWPYQV
jgi:hypothetical protein